MRNSLPRWSDFGRIDHFGLAYERWPPRQVGGEVDTDDRNDWSRNLEQVRVSDDYRQFFERWRASFGPDVRVAVVELRGRMLIGHGNPSATEVGLTVHHTWGVPVIPGAALKGLLAHRFDILYGPEGDEDDLQDAQRNAWRGVRWAGDSIARGPGAHYRALFGSPDAQQDASEREAGREAGASAGLVTFHDALYVPGSVIEAEHVEDRPFARDVLTVHHKSYYDGSGEVFPNDWESPNPVAFMTVRRPARFLIALGGPSDWTELAERHLLEALQGWGVGGKTSLGYGRLSLVASTPTVKASGGVLRSGDPRERPAVVDQLEEFLKGDGVREKLEVVLSDWPERLLALDGYHRNLVANRISSKLKASQRQRLPELARRVDEFVRRLKQGD